MSRYLAMALFTSVDAPQRWWGLRYCWFATSVGLTLPSVVAVDQLLRHPAMSPKKLLVWYSPFLAAYAAVILFGVLTPTPDRVVGWIPHLSRGWQAVLSITQGILVLGFIGGGLLFMGKVPSRRLRAALLGLVVGQGGLGIDGLVLAFGGWYFRPFLYTEMLMLLAIWHAYETSAALSQGG